MKTFLELKQDFSKKTKKYKNSIPLTSKFKRSELERFVSRAGVVLFGEGNYYRIKIKGKTYITVSGKAKISYVHDTENYYYYKNIISCDAFGHYKTRFDFFDILRGEWYENHVSFNDLENIEQISKEEFDTLLKIIYNEKNRKE